MKNLLLPFALALLSVGKLQAQGYVSLNEKTYMLKSKAPAYRTSTDTTNAAVIIPQNDNVLVIGRMAPKWVVIRRMGFNYFLPARYVVDVAKIDETIVAQQAKPQNTPSTVPRTEEYCMMVAIQKLLSPKVSIMMDYGQAYGLFDDRRVKDEGGRVMTFNSVIDALNYLNSQGWQFVNAYAVTASGQNTYHYVMRRPVNEKE